MGWTNHPAKRPIGQALIDLRRAEGYLMEFYEYANDTHPEMGSLVISAGQGIETIMQALLNLWAEAWVHFPLDLQHQLKVTEDCELL